jgi:HTH-type transcriptional regulator/antitoxin HigA
MPDRGGFHFKPIRNEADLAAATTQVARLWGAAPGSREADRLEVLSLLIEAYEDEHAPMDPPDPVAAVLFRLEQQGLDRKALSRLMGSSARASEFLGGKRDLSIRMIRKLNAELGIPAEILIRPIRKRTLNEVCRSFRQVS